ncbi:hypothetical protein RAAC3_TM7C00001G0899 [Candidatus Saccharibacteria bacterium RAAC3_TM7_1]|nr:hypothetical protein RAAC3_TM7C00001G0899 [Candidatus Saccharibacteria bacterium RAAC3_TM7_1]
MAKKRSKPIHHAEDFGIDVTLGDMDMFRWFLLCYLFVSPEDLYLKQTNVSLLQYRDDAHRVIV